MFRVHIEQGNNDGSHDFLDSEVHEALADITQEVLRWKEDQSHPFVITLSHVDARNPDAT